MPIALDPQKTFEITLAQSRPGAVFIARYLTCRQWVALSEIVDSVTGGQTTATQVVNELAAAVMERLVGWRGVDVPFENDALLDVVTPAELFELSSVLLARTRAAEDDLKKSESPAPSHGDAPAPQAAPATA